MSRPGNGNPNQDEIQVKWIRVALPGVGQPVFDAASKIIAARPKEQSSGAEIAWVRGRRAFRVDWYASGVIESTRWVMESRVEEYEEA